MTLFRIFLVTIIAVVGVYTAIVIANHGMGLYPIFFADMGDMTWRGQFNLDFLCFLIMSGVWVAWRHAFSATGFVLGFAAFNLGAPFLAAYLLVESYRNKGDSAAILLGKAPAANRR